jgi:hypothetical protein
MSSDLLKGGNLFTAAAIGIGASIFGPVILPAVRPIAKSLIKGGLMAYDQGRAAWAELNERTSDMIAEAREEMEAPEAAVSAAGAAAPAARRAAKKPGAEPRSH